MESFELEIIDKAAAFAKTKLRNVLSSHGWDHTSRVVKNAERIAAAEPEADPFVVTVSAILHDISREEEDKSSGSVCHAESGSRIAFEFLRECRLNESRTSHISSCIRTHRYRDSMKPETLEARILYDADKLDSIGAVGIGRAFLFSGEIGARLHNTEISVDQTSAYSEEDTAFREYKVKLRHIKDNMLTREGKRLAEERHLFMDEFFSRLKREMTGDI